MSSGADEDVKDVVKAVRTPPRTGIRPVALETTPERAAVQLGKTFFLVWKNRIYYAHEDGTVSTSKKFTQTEVQRFSGIPI
jgi:hypothetical protein